MAAEHQQPDPLQEEEEFSNWTKAVRSLMYARDGSINYIKSKLEPFVDKLQRMHGSDKKEHFKELLSKVAVNGKVDDKQKPSLSKDRFSLADKSCSTCVKIFEEQLNAFNQSRWHSKKWIPYSTEKQIDPSSYWWVLAKMYIAKPYFVDAEGPEEVDPAAIFNLLLNCKLFDDRDINECVEKLVKLRNKVMHIANYQLTRQEMIESFDLIKDFLRLTQFADNTKEIIKVEKLEKSTVVLVEENGELSKFAKEALHLQEKSVNADFESPEGIKPPAIKPLKASNLELLARLNHHGLSRKDINVNVDSDGDECFISDMCQMSDGTVAVIDSRHKKLKRLDDNFNVRDFCQIDLTPRSIVPVSSTQVAILSESWKIDLITVGESIVHERTIDLEKKDEFMFLFGFEYCNDQFWIHGRMGIYIHSSSGSMINFIKNELYGVVLGKLTSSSSLCTNKDKTRVYATTGRFVYAFDTDGKRLFELDIQTREPSYPIITTVGNDFIVSRSNVLFSYDDCIYDMGGNTLFVFFTGKGKVPQSLLYDEKKCCLIVAFEDKTIQVFQLQNLVK